MSLIKVYAYKAPSILGLTLHDVLCKLVCEMLTTLECGHTAPWHVAYQFNNSMNGKFKNYVNSKL